MRRSSLAILLLATSADFGIGPYFLRTRPWSSHAAPLQEQRREFFGEADERDSHATHLNNLNGEQLPSCPSNTIPTAKFCICPPATPKCAGSKCNQGKNMKSLQPVQGFKLKCADCRCIEADLDISTTNKSDWLPCSAAGEVCECDGMIRFGHGEHWTESVASKGILCTSRYLPKPSEYTDDDERHRCECHRGLPSGELSKNYQGTWKHRSPRLLIFTVATHREPFIGLTEHSVDALGDNFKLHVVGIGEQFKGYGWKLKSVRKYLLKHKNNFDVVMFTDSFDSFVFASPDEIMEKFLSFEAPMVVSAEVNIWPNPHLAAYMPESSKSGHYPYPNSGGYIGYLDYILDFYTNVVEIQAKSDCVDDQGELIKALALNHSVFQVDHQAVIFQTLFGSAKNDIEIVDQRPLNRKTGTRPCVLHANGWDKQPLLGILDECGLLTGNLKDAVQAKKQALEKSRTLQTREKGINDRCNNANPNAGLDPDENIILAYGLTSKERLLKARLQEANIPWNLLEKQTWEIQEYLGHCPVQDYLKKDDSFEIPVSASQDGFRIFVYPISDEQEQKLPSIYRAIRQVVTALPYYTQDHSEASLFIPPIDTSCWCEQCLGSRPFATMSPESEQVSTTLAMLDHWNGGRNHILFEYSDAPCLPYLAEQAIIAKVGLSEFHFRDGHDVSMPLFAMVEWNASARRTPPSSRRFLLTFRGTRSPASDQIRKHLWKIHSEDQGVFVACACRWYDPSKENARGYDGRCKDDEEQFEKYTYTDLMLGTKFSLVVEGFGYHSFRLTEVLAAGAIPVIAIDHYILPYQSVLNWSEFSVRIPERSLLDVQSILQSIPDSAVNEMQRKVVKVYEEFFSSLGAQVVTALEQVRIEKFVDPSQRADHIRRLNLQGLPHKLPESVSSTPRSVQQDSQMCNAPTHRRQKARDGAVMR